MKPIVILTLAWIAISCQSKKEISVFISIEKINADLDSVISNTLSIQVLGTGYEWSEGPLWVESEKMLLFSDVPANRIYKWTAEKGTDVYLTPSGYTGNTATDGELGSNGLTLNADGNLVLCQHGDRRIARMNTSTAHPTPTFTTIADSYNGKRFNSPNDVVFYKNDYYFTDPLYGLPKNWSNSLKEISFQGVYRTTANGKTILLLDSLTRPNGLAFMPNGKKLIVANSDPDKARWYEYILNDSMQIQSGKILYDATANTKTEKGFPDGLKINSKGTIFATGPGGVWIFDATGKLLGKIKLQEATSNCALSPDEKTLFVTNDMYVLKIQLQP